MFKFEEPKLKEVSGHKLGQITGIDPRRISDKLKRGELQRNENGLYDLEQSMRALGISTETMELLENDNAPINIQQMRAIKERETAYLKRLERGLAEGSLIQVEDVMKKLTPLFAGIKVRLLALPSKLAPVMANETNSAVCKSTLEGELRVVLAELSSGIERELALGTGEVIGTAAAFDSSSQWAQAERVLSPEASAEPGKWRNERNPALVEIMDSVSDPTVSEIVVMRKPAWEN